MTPPSLPIVRLSEMAHEDEGDLFVLMTAKEALVTRDGKPYFKVSFRDAGREVSFPIWDNSPWAADCREQWTPGVFYKLRAMYRETPFGPQLEIRKIREVIEADRADGFDPTMCLAQSRFEPREMYEELCRIVEAEITHEALRRTVTSLLETHRDRLLSYPAARRHHHAFVGGLLEHVLSVTRSCLYLAQEYARKYPDLQPPLDKELVVAGAVLHDVGKLEELDQQPTDTLYTAAGALVGHLLLGRDMVRRAAAEAGLEADALLRLEHLIIAHQRLPEWGSPKPPMTPEALIVHYADDLDAKFDMMCSILRDDRTPGPLTSDKNLLRYRVYRGPAG
jgi:3'-5' exoribonuclease